MAHLENTKKEIFYVINKNISYEILENNYIVLNVNNGEYYELNSSLSFIWNQIRLKKEESAILQNAKKHFSLSDGQVLEILSSLTKLEALGLIKKIGN